MTGLTDYDLRWWDWLRWRNVVYGRILLHCVSQSLLSCITVLIKTASMHTILSANLIPYLSEYNNHTTNVEASAIQA